MGKIERGVAMQVRKGVGYEDRWRDTVEIMRTDKGLTCPGSSTSRCLGGMEAGSRGMSFRSASDTGLGTVTLVEVAPAGGGWGALLGGAWWRAGPEESLWAVALQGIHALLSPPQKRTDLGIGRVEGAATWILLLHKHEAWPSGLGAPCTCHDLLATTAGLLASRGSRLLMPELPPVASKNLCSSKL